MNADFAKVGASKEYIETMFEFIDSIHEGRHRVLKPYTVILIAIALEKLWDRRAWISRQKNRSTALSNEMVAIPKQIVQCCSGSDDEEVNSLCLGVVYLAHEEVMESIGGLKQEDKLGIRDGLKKRSDLNEAIDFVTTHGYGVPSEQDDDAEIDSSSQQDKFQDAGDDSEEDLVSDDDGAGDDLVNVASSDTRSLSGLTRPSQATPQLPVARKGPANKRPASQALPLPDVRNVRSRPNPPSFSPALRAPSLLIQPPSSKGTPGEGRSTAPAILQSSATPDDSMSGQARKSSWQGGEYESGEEESV